jgi:hypothetical protein
VQAERICSGEILEEDVSTSTSPSPLYLPLEERRSGRGQGAERNPKTFVRRVNSGNGGGNGNGKRGPQGPVGGDGGVGGHGPAGPNGNCAWDGPGACAGRGKSGGIGGVGGVGGIGEIGWAGPKPNCAWDGPGACKGKERRTGKKKKVISKDIDIELQNQTQIASEITIGDLISPTDIFVDNRNINTSSGRKESRPEEPIYYDYLDGQPSIDFEGEYNDGNNSENMDKSDNIQQVIEQETGTKLKENLLQIDEDLHGLRTLDYDINELEILEHSEKIKKRTAKKASTIISQKASEPKAMKISSPIGSDLWTVQQWIRHG